MQVHIRRERPGSWAECRSKLRHGWLMPFVLVEYGLDWVVYALSHWRFLELLEYLGSFGVLVAVIFYFSESGDRLKQKHYQAWQVINSAEGKGGNGGRIEALEELNADGISLVGVDVSGAFLQGIRLQRASLARSNFSAADVRDCDLSFADLSDADLRANLRHCILRSVNMEHADLTEADLFGADLTGA